MSEKHTITHDEAVQAARDAWNGDHEAMMKAHAYIAQQRARDTELEALREKCKWLGQWHEMTKDRDTELDKANEEIAEWKRNWAEITADEEARDTELTSLRERCKVLANEVRAWRSTYEYRQASEVMGVDFIRLASALTDARAATDAANALENK